MDNQKKKTVKELALDKAKRIMDGVGAWCAYYRANPHRFAIEYLNVPLKDFQKFLLVMMEMNCFVMLICSRGLGKTYLIALDITIRCILYPGTKVIVASGARGQANEVLNKITEEFMKQYDWGSENLRNEISDFSVSQNKATINFKNGSFIKVVTANDNARSARANIIVVDEFRMVDPMVIKTVLRRFNASERSCGFHSKPEYVNYPKERNREMYLSSAWMKAHWSYEKFRSYFADMLDINKKYYCCAIPYQMSIRSNLASREAIMDEMSEADFDPATFSYEMGSLFYGQTNGAFFDYESIEKRRTIKHAYYPVEAYRKTDLTVPKLITGEHRILSCDIALMSSGKNRNDASSLMINSAIPVTNEEYLSNLVYLRNYEGLTTDELALEIMRTFYFFRCTDLVVDLNGSRCRFKTAELSGNAEMLTRTEGLIKGQVRGRA